MPLRHTGFPPAETSLALKWPEQSREQELVQGDSLQSAPEMCSAMRLPLWLQVLDSAVPGAGDQNRFKGA
jgi:hypothetical protein